VILATNNHRFWSVDTQKWIEAGELTRESVLFNSKDQNVSIKNLKSYSKEQTVYNLTVANDHTYFVGQSGVLGHNANKCKFDFGPATGIGQFRSLADMTHHEILKVFKNTGLTFKGHAIKRLKDSRTKNLGFKTPKDIEQIWKKGYMFDAGGGDIGFSYRGMEIIVIPKKNIVRTIRPAKKGR